MAQVSSRSTVENGLILFFGLLALLGCLCSSSVMLLPVADAEATYYEIAPLFLGLTLAGVGSGAMVWLRRRYRMGWPLLAVAMVLWSMGSVVFAFGLTATMLYDEPNEFLSNFGFAVGICIAPGLFLALIGLFLFWVEARKGRKEGAGETAVSPDESADEWLELIKAEEKSKLEEDTF